MASLVSSSVLSTAAGIVSLVFGFASSVVVARLLGPEGAGEVSFALFIAMTVSLVANLGLPNVLLRYIPTYDRAGHPGGGLARVLLPYFAFPILLCAAGLAAYGAWSQASGESGNYAGHAWAMTVLLLISYGVASYSEGAARGLHRFGETTKLAFVGCLLQLPIVALGGYFFGVPGAIAGHAARHLPQALRVWHYVAGKPDPGTMVTPKMKALGRNSWFSAVVGMLVWTRVEFFFLGHFFGASEIGYYAAGLTLAGLVVQLPTQMLSGLTPHIGRRHDAGDAEGITRTYNRTMRWLSILILPICFGGAAVMGELLPLLFGAEFRAAVPMSQVLVAFACITALSTIPTMIIEACERSDIFVVISPIAAVVSVATFALVIPDGAGFGSAWARSGVHGFWLGILVWFCWTRLSIRLDIGGLMLVVIAAVLCAGAAYGVLLAVEGLAGLLLAIACGAIVYGISLRVLRVVPRDDVVALVVNLPSAVPRGLTDIVYRLMLLVAATPHASNR